VRYHCLPFFQHPDTIHHCVLSAVLLISITSLCNILINLLTPRNELRKYISPALVIFSLLSLFWNKKLWEELIAYFSLIRHGPHAHTLWRMASPFKRNNNTVRIWLNFRIIYRKYNMLHLLLLLCTGLCTLSINVSVSTYLHVLFCIIRPYPLNNSQFHRLWFSFRIIFLSFLYFDLQGIPFSYLLWSFWRWAFGAQVVLSGFFVILYHYETWTHEFIPMGAISASDNLGPLHGQNTRTSVCWLSLLFVDRFY
jgi:hypothetical protein